jgi:hypothetical protein
MAEEQVDQKPKLNISIVYEGTREFIHLFCAVEEGRGSGTARA